MSDPTTPPPVTPTPTLTPIPTAAPIAYEAVLPAGYIEPDPSMRTLAMIAHLLQFAGLFVGPLILYLIKKDDPTTNAYAKQQMKEVLNWSFTVLIAMFVSALLFIIIIGIFLYFAVIITHIVYLILNAVKANKGQVAKYPWSIKFFK